MPTQSQALIGINHNATLIIQSLTNIDYLTHVQPENDDTTLTRIKPFLMDVLDFCEDIQGLSDLSALIRTQTTASTLLNALQYFANISNKIAAYRISVANVSDRENLRELRGTFESEVLQHYDDLIHCYQLIGSIGGLKQAKLESEKVKKIIHDYHNEMIGIFSDAKKLLKQTEDVLTSSKQVSAISSINTYSMLFHEQASKHKSTAKLWISALILTLILGLALLYFSYTSFFPNHIYQSETLTLIQLIGNRGIIFTLTIYMTTVCVKHYRANKHNEVINIHRAKALETFQTFINSTDKSDRETYNYVLAQCVNTIFAHQLTGYSESEKENSSNVTILDTLQNILLKKKQD